MSVNVLIKLKPEFWDNPPCVSVEIDNIVHPTLEFTTSGKIFEYKFKISNEKIHQIKIERFGKLISDTIVENNKVIKDQLLHIEDIVVDSVSLKDLIYLGNFYPHYPEPWASEQRNDGIILPEVENYRSTLYHNGTWILNFDLPIHIWFFTNINRQ